jgi:DNA-binding transcriptional LysR family regulator
MSDIDIDDVRKLDGRLLLVFRELLRRRSVTATAAELHLSQSAVSHALSRLRVIHDEPLFIRRPHGLEPTRRALELGPIVDQLIELSGLLHGGPSEWSPDTAERRFDIAAPEFVVAVLGAELLTRWQKSAPGVMLTTHQLDHQEVAQRLTRGDLDVAIGRFGNRQPAALRREALYSDTYCVVAARHHPEISGSIGMGEYRSLGHVIAGSTSEGNEHETIPAGLRVRAIVPGWMTALSIVSAGNAIATCPRLLAEHHADTLGLQVLDLPGRTVGIEVSTLRRRDEPPPPTRWLVDEIRALVSP